MYTFDTPNRSVTLIHSFIHTGDPAGDLGFFLVRDRSLAQCKMPEQANTARCFLAYEPVIRRFYVELDQRWGPYMRCNPLPFYHGGEDGRG